MYWFIWDVFQHDYHVCWLICSNKPSKPSRSVTKNVLAVDGEHQPKKWRKVRGHDKPIHGNCAFYFPGGITVVDLNWLVQFRNHQTDYEGKGNLQAITFRDSARKLVALLKYNRVVRVEGLKTPPMHRNDEEICSQFFEGPKRVPNLQTIYCEGTSLIYSYHHLYIVYRYTLITHIFVKTNVQTNQTT